LDLLEKYPNDKKLEQLLDRLQKSKQENFLKSVDYEEEIIEKLGLTKQFKDISEAEKKEKLKQMYKILDKFFKEKNYNA
jgi:ribosome assembly protein YihI (activator of Der GTPase)